MTQAKPIRAGRHPAIRTACFALGCVLIGITPFVGVLPGPGGVFTFALGLGLMLRNSAWAKRHYVRFKRRWPKPGGWCDRGMRRASAGRRRAIARANAGAAD